MDSEHRQHKPLSSKDDWNERYLADRGENIWSGAPNGALVNEIENVEPGTVIDLGCGEGGDAIWLAERGWVVTGVDISEVALERARAAADERGVEVKWVQGDFVADPPESDDYDLVSTHYPALLRSDRERAIAALLTGVKPGGTLLFVAHLPNVEAAREHGFDPDDYLNPSDIVESLDDEWEIVVNEVRERVAGPSSRSPHHEDIVLKATRRTGG